MPDDGTGCALLAVGALIMWGLAIAEVLHILAGHP